MFLLMGQFASKGGLSKALFAAANKMIGHKRGGVALSTIAACGGFGAICGSSLATAATMGQVALPELRKYGYSNRLSTAVLAAGGTLGVLIPPSVVLVIYAILTEQNIAKLFIAAFVPGFLAILGYMATVWLMVRFGNEQTTEQAASQQTEKIKTFASVWPVLAISACHWRHLSRMFHPHRRRINRGMCNEFVAYFNGDVDKEAMKEALLETVQATAMIFAILFGASIFNSFLAFSRLPFEAAEMIIALDASPTYSDHYSDCLFNTWLFYG